MATKDPQPDYSMGSTSNYLSTYPYGHYRYSPDETVTETEETTEYNEHGKVVKKTTKRTTRTKPRSHSPYPWWSYTSQPYSSKIYTDSNIRPTAYSGD